MSSKIILTITAGVMRGKSFEISGHDTILVGRSRDCKINLPDDDPFVSRHHFIMEANPPQATLRDLGSKNGTYVNRVKHGGRELDETPEEGSQREYPVVELKDQDVIRIGDTSMRVQVEQPAVCASCGAEIPESERAEALQADSSHKCAECRKKPPKTGDQPKKKSEPKIKDKPPVKPDEEDGMALLMRMLEQLRQPPDQAPEIPGYETVKLLGEGGMGKVFLLRNMKSDKKVALKIMHARVAVNKDAKEKFQREIDNMNALKHPNLVELYEQGYADGTFYFLMEFCPLGDTAGWAKKRGGKLKLDEAGMIMLQSLKGLAFMHKKHYVHRDLKPQNILLAGSERKWIAKVTDYGMSKNFDQAGMSGMTMTGDVAGTVPFMSRDQVRDFKYAEPPVDIWSMGATFYNLLTARFPRDFAPRKDPILQVLQNPIVPIRKRDSSIPKRVADVIDTSLSDNVKKRYQDASEMLAALEKVL
jgi:serine/threonine-protein kinase